METQLELIRDQQKETWNKFSPGWRKWDEMVMEFLRPMGDEIIRRIKPKGSEYILDVAAGTGEPGLTIAGMLKDGKVMITDLAEKMLEVARDNASSRGIKNIETKACDVSELPFEDNTFDGVSCRMGFMFFPDMQLAANEIARVLKPGGRVATSIWNGPEKNFWITATMNIINQNMQLPPPPPGAPGIFRCAKEGTVANLFLQAGLKNISETEVRGKLNCGTIENYWKFTTEVAAPVVAALNKADDLMKDKITNEVMDLLKKSYPDGNVVIDSSAQVIYGEK